MSYDDGPAVVARFTAAMSSRDPDRVAAALDEIRDRLPREHVPPPPPEVLDGFVGGAPSEVLLDYIWVLAHHGLFEPPLDAAEMVRWCAEAVLRHPDGSAALRVVLLLTDEDQPPGADVADVLAYVARRGVRPGREERGAEYLARYLLDNTDTYGRALPALAAWRGVPVLDDILHEVAPYVRPADRAGLGLGTA